MDFTIEVSSPWFEYIQNGTKTVEGRKGTPRWLLIAPGMKGTIYNPNTKESFVVKCISIQKYPNLSSYLLTETLDRTLPGITSIEDGIRVYLQWSTEDEIEKYGFLGISIRTI